ncbi:MAG: hypothetical protein ACK5U8_16445, partial [Deltaproteobacteria bacterium]
HNAGFSSGGLDFGSYASTQAASTRCAGVTRGACALVRFRNRSMPPGSTCGVSPTGAGCLTAAEEAMLQSWIDGGQLP